MSAPEVNVALLRKAVEWAEAEAARPQGQWLQAMWTTTPDTWPRLRAQAGLTAECGTTYCIAGYICHITGIDGEGQGWAYPAADQLGIDDDASDRLFDAGNDIEDVRRIAEEIAGERL